MSPRAGALIELPWGARALFTDRSHGNLSSVGGEGCERGLQARERLRRACGVQALARAYQVHGTAVARIYAQDSPPPPDASEQPHLRADGHAVARARVGATVLAADCVPVVLAAKGAAAAIHAGWRGLAAGVLEEGVRALRGVGGRGEIVAVVGPCAGACCYEVGEEVHAAFAADPGGVGSPEHGGAAGRGHGAGGGFGADRGPDADHGPGADCWPGADCAVGADGTLSYAPSATIDLRAIAHRRLRAAGVASIGDLAACTICDERFFSHRREGPAAGRQAGIAWLT